MIQNEGTDLQGKTALVTGAGATGGIGFAVARQLKAQGAEVVITGRDAERGEAAAAELGARFVRADLADPGAAQDLAQEVGPVDVLVNNAGVFPMAPTPDQGEDGFDETFAVNVRAPFFLTAALAPQMAANGGGSIVNVTTMVASIGMPGLAVYSATKAALESLTRTWAAEFGSGGVRVNAVSPGPTSSDKAMETMGEGVTQMGTGTPLGRVADPDEIASVVAFLAGGRSSYVTGATFAADGGRTAV